MMPYSGKGDWDFRSADTKEYTHCFHIYPAMMIPQVARGLVDLYGNEGGILFDPYCGTGTSLVEARLAGMDGIGTDINPTARMIAFAKTTDYNLKRLTGATEKVLSYLEENLDSISDYSGFREPENVTWEQLEKWFPAKSIGEICCAIEKISEVGYMRGRLFLQVALSECLRLVSFQRNGEFKLYRMPLDKRDLFYEPLLPKLRDRIERNLAGLRRFSETVSPATEVKIRGFNTVHTNGRRHFPYFPCADIVVTSPPYGDSGTTVAYGQFSWLSNVWLWLDDRAPGALDREMMGGRKSSLEEFGCAAMDEAIAKVAQVDQNRANEVMHFYDEYLRSIRNVAAVIVEGGYSCFVVGNRIVKGVQLPTDAFTAWAFEQCGFTHVVTYIRDIPNKRMPSKNSPSNISGVKSSTMVNEYIVICKKIDF
uniref:Adenine-specific DNA methylase n=1 Tax=uncultured marine group II/III euryarchaeote KM3_74_C08 TaxID=1456501 RepID=A0A075HPV9_9EURY|nr:adenine-specific DNA methylase [uncultured marine group II/III euryarchaeote KM3_74_C08]